MRKRIVTRHFSVFSFYAVEFYYVLSRIFHPQKKGEFGILFFFFNPLLKKKDGARVGVFFFSFFFSVKKWKSVPRRFQDQQTVTNERVVVVFGDEYAWIDCEYLDCQMRRGSVCGWEGLCRAAQKLRPKQSISKATEPTMRWLDQDTEHFPETKRERKKISSYATRTTCQFKEQSRENEGIQCTRRLSQMLPHLRDKEDIQKHSYHFYFNKISHGNYGRCNGNFSFFFFLLTFFIFCYYCFSSVQFKF